MCFNFFYPDMAIILGVFLNRFESWGHTLWSDEEEVSSLQCHAPTCQPPDVRSNPALISKSSHSLLNLVNVELNYKHFLIYSYSWRLQCGLPTFSIYAQVPLTAWERPGHGVHSSSVFQAEVQSTAQVSTLTLFASRTGTEAHLPSPRGEKSPLFFGGGGIENVLTQYTFNNKLWHFFSFQIAHCCSSYLIFV